MTIRTTLLAAALLAGSTGIALAGDDRPGPDWMPIDQAYRTLTEAGYRDIREIEADDGRWEAKATKDGVAVKVKVDPRSGAIAAKRKD
ncbi:PepSY domain-containing protein [Enterovirga rhinocerotis]|uniref:YpeB-like protein with putative protease inhibitory function n=1 Tax=Enterovirga rhinocerotis TaxID=1339210 RepID=A0A4R7BS00_9HYPH|nr:PepSY domain-containing protein [Enterovirga rhinocerotis]TDR88171.1 YpeB-like protein with putative protease inhibitory function [Enterovirga rhinocerotis]